MRELPFTVQELKVESRGIMWCVPFAVDMEAAVAGVGNV